MNAHLENLKNQDPEIYDAIMNEFRREEFTIELIASENAVSLRLWKLRDA
jgi:glycine/serine hydroxymethyltransferase